ncbi:cytochrome c oxidase assembly protein [Actinokineospora spheciospongiae]|uniref:cytochrome c oxidase assembly protein n=1 Tax=Actinokineospora spheciospongiae TaxID=909613 RepID=UPI000D712605|nr:cytochrome c oxidase assembly protein [Actinokineospora spheciospongiae]PWW53744.1 putative copper resistance protein D [Actinokineospora spheciospongiae]
MGSDSPAAGAEPSAPSRAAALWPVVVLGAVAAAVVAVGLTARTAAPVLAGLPDPGIAVRAGLPGVRVVAEVLAVLVVGAYLAAVLLVPEGPDRDRALRLGGRLAGFWALLSAVLVVLTVADAMGMTLGEVVVPSMLFPGIGRFTVAIAWLVSAHLAGLVWLWEKLAVPPIALLATAVAGVAPVALTGHSSAGGNHDWAGDSLMAHVVAASVWVGGLVAVLVVAGAHRSYAVTATRLYSAIALGCWLVVAATGVVNAFLRVHPVDLLTTDYGYLLLAKTAAVLLLGALGYLHRVRTIPRLEAGKFRAFLRLGAVEVLLMLVTVGIAVGLARSPGPRAGAAPGSVTEELLGYGLPDRPTLVRLATQWRPDLVFGTLALVGALWYLSRLRNRAWPAERTASWLLGCLVLAVATSSGLGRYEPAVFSAHLLVQVLVGFVAAVLLAHGRAPELAGVRAPEGAEDAGAGRWPKPWTVAGVYTVPPLLLYAGGLHDQLAGQHWVRVVLLLWSLAAGWVLFSAPVPRRGPVLAVAVVYLVCGIALLERESVLGQSFYTALELGWRHDAAGIQAAAGWIAVAAAVLVAVYAGSLGARREPEPY